MRAPKGRQTLERGGKLTEKLDFVRDKPKL